jgi:hypothetical protein
MIYRIGLYERLGFTLTGEIPHDALKPHGGLTGTLIYWKRIAGGTWFPAGRSPAAATSPLGMKKLESARTAQRINHLKASWPAALSYAQFC